DRHGFRFGLLQSSRSGVPSEARNHVLGARRSGIQVRGPGGGILYTCRLLRDLGSRVARVCDLAGEGGRSRKLARNELLLASGARQVGDEVRLLQENGDVAAVG